jgi:hypothetical protein
VEEVTANNSIEEYLKKLSARASSKSKATPKSQQSFTFLLDLLTKTVRRKSSLLLHTNGYLVKRLIGISLVGVRQ